MSQRPLRALAVASLVVPALVLAATAGFSYRSHFAQADARVERAVDVVFEHTTKVFETLDLVTAQADQFLAGMTDEQIRDREAEVHAHLRTLGAGLEQVLILLVIDAMGQPLAFSGLYPMVRETDYSDRDYFRALRDGVVPPGGSAVSAVLRGRTREDVMTFLIARRRGERAAVAGGTAGGATDATRSAPAPFRGVIAVSTKATHFSDYYRQVALGDVDTITLIRADGSFLARYPGEVIAGAPALPSDAEFMRSIARNPERGAYETVSVVDGVRRHYAYRRLVGRPVYVTAGIDRATVLASWRASMLGPAAFSLLAAAGLHALARTALTRARREADALARLAERTRELDRVWRTSRDLFLVVGFDGTYRTANPAWAEALGYGPEDVVGLRYDSLVHPDDAARNAGYFERVTRGEVVRDVDLRMRARDGSYRTLSWTFVPEGEVFYASGRDVTDRQQLAEQLRQSQKLEAVGQLTGGVAHDFNNLLTVIRSSTDLLRRPGLSDERKRRYIDAISDTVDRAAKLTGQLLAFSRRQALEPEVFDAAARVKGIGDMLRTLVGSRVKLVTELPAAPLLIEADASQFETALVNMAISVRRAPAMAKLST